MEKLQKKIIDYFINYIYYLAYLLLKSLLYIIVYSKQDRGRNN
jgi:hypothetical protein